MEDITLKKKFNNKIRCKWSMDVSRYYDGEVKDESEAKKIAEHIESCQECKDRLANYRLMTSRIRKNGENNIDANDPLSQYLSGYPLTFSNQTSIWGKLVEFFGFAQKKK